MKTAAEHKDERERLLRMLVERLQRRHYTDIRVSRLEEFEGIRPPVIFWKNTDEGFVPDVMARKGEGYFLFQVETGQSVTGEMAQRQIRLFSGYARYYRRHFCLVVPRGAREKGKDALMRAEADERYTDVVDV